MTPPLPPPRPSASPPVSPYAVALADPSGTDAADVTEVTAAHDLIVDLDIFRPPPADAARAARTAPRAARRTAP
ncbi:4-hydroxythreonine-4-phosphate dehydrogenase, partial [Streptomyces botrytidirepellens]